AQLDAVCESTQKAVEVLALLGAEGGEEVILRGRDGAFGTAEQPLAVSAEPQHVAPAVNLMAGALDEIAIRELGGDRGEVAAIDPERIGELRLACLTEHLELFENEELLGAEAEGTHRAADSSSCIPAETGQEGRHRHLLGGCCGARHAVRVRGACSRLPQW
ncbi:MAG: hypothetical protein QOG15_1429, partial [Solirubrobacteraceae bacterium]|nr:hypothetical protein [Solirubrobacteraceae bacterium]